MNIVIGADHNGVELKERVKSWVKDLGHVVVDIGPYTSDKSVDYTNYARQVGEMVARAEVHRGMLICGTGQGMVMAANKIRGVRAALVHNVASAALAREHNDSNVLCLGAWITTTADTKKIVHDWLITEYGQYRHVKRVECIERNPDYKLVMANGVFDIVHNGHIELLNFAKSLGDKLVVAVNSDRAVAELKGKFRPITPELDRKRIVGSLKAVDEVILLDSPRTDELVRTINPDVIVKGGEWTADQVRKRDNIPEHVGVVIYPLKSGYSSTAIIERIQQWREK